VTLPFQQRFNDVGWAALGGSRFASGRIDPNAKQSVRPNNPLSATD